MIQIEENQSGTKHYQVECQFGVLPLWRHFYLKEKKFNQTKYSCHQPFVSGIRPNPSFLINLAPKVTTDCNCPKVPFTVYVLSSELVGYNETVEWPSLNISVDKEDCDLHFSWAPIIFWITYRISQCFRIVPFRIDLMLKMDAFPMHWSGWADATLCMQCRRAGWSGENPAVPKPRRKARSLKRAALPQFRPLCGNWITLFQYNVPEQGK